MLFEPNSDSLLVLVQWGAVIGASLLAALSDIRSHRISNRLTVPLFVCGVLWSFYRAGVWGVADSLAACAVVALPFVILWAVAGGGAGDAKLMGAIGAWVGVANGLVALTAVVVCGAAMAVLLALWKRRLRVVLWRVHAMTAKWSPVPIFSGLAYRILGPTECRDDKERIVMPYGLAIFAGVLIAAVWVNV